MGRLSLLAFGLAVCLAGPLICSAQVLGNPLSATSQTSAGKGDHFVHDFRKNKLCTMLI